jgi:hypothetical protein
LEYSNRVFARQYGDSGAQDDVLGNCGEPGQDGVWRGDREVVAVMFAYVEVAETFLPAAPST